MPLSPERLARNALLDPDTVTKVCIDCDRDLPLRDFNVSTSGRFGRHARCRTCRPLSRKSAPNYEQTKAREGAKKREKYASDAAWRERVLARNRDARYGLRPGQYEELLAAQGGVCAICATADPGGRGGFYVDHDHGCCDGVITCGNCVRGLLCIRCNTALGMFGDSVDNLMSGAAYLLSNTSLIAGLSGSGKPNLAASVMRSSPAQG